MSSGPALFVEGVNIMGMAVKCGGCGGKFHQITGKFRAEPPVRGSYLRMIPRYRSWGWYAFPEEEWVVGDNVLCPQCGTPYSFLSIMRQIRRFVDAELGRAEVQGGADTQETGQTVEERGDGGENAAENTVGIAATGEMGGEEVQSDQENGLDGADFGSDDADFGDFAGSAGIEVEDQCSAEPEKEEQGIYTLALSDPKNVKMMVMRMTADGCTQAHIAKTCNLSVYMVRQIQNGRKV